MAETPEQKRAWELNRAFYRGDQYAIWKPTWRDALEGWHRRFSCWLTIHSWMKSDATCNTEFCANGCGTSRKFDECSDPGGEYHESCP